MDDVHYWPDWYAERFPDRRPYGWQFADRQQSGDYYLGNGTVWSGKLFARIQEGKTEVDILEELEALYHLYVSLVDINCTDMNRAYIQLAQNIRSRLEGIRVLLK